MPMEQKGQWKQLEMCLSVRSALLSDVEIYYEWVNDPVVRESAFNEEPIGWESHILWFNKKISDSSTFLYIVENLDNVPIGQVRFELKDTDARLDYSIDKLHRGKGLAVGFLEAAINNFLRDCEVVKTITAEIKPSNKVSVHVLLKVGFFRIDLIKDPVVRLVFNRVLGE